MFSRIGRRAPTHVDVDCRIRGAKPHIQQHLDPRVGRSASLSSPSPKPQPSSAPDPLRSTPRSRARVRPRSCMRVMAAAAVRSQRARPWPARAVLTRLAVDTLHVPPSGRARPSDGTRRRAQAVGVLTAKAVLQDGRKRSTDDGSTQADGGRSRRIGRTQAFAAAGDA